jgi:hypothetical protein
MSICEKQQDAHKGRVLRIDCSRRAEARRRQSKMMGDRAEVQGRPEVQDGVLGLNHKQD